MAGCKERNDFGVRYFWGQIPGAGPNKYELLGKELRVSVSLSLK